MVKWKRNLLNVSRLFTIKNADWLLIVHNTFFIWTKSMHLSDRMYNCCQQGQRGLRGISGETIQQKMCTITQTNINVNKTFPCIGVITCSCVGGQGVCVRWRTCELCLPRLRWTLQHSSQINTPLFTEAQRGSEREKENLQVKITTLESHLIDESTLKNMSFKELLKE